MTTNSVYFEVLINESFSSFNESSSLSPVGNKRLLSIVNDYENGEWRQNNFNKFIWNNISNTCLTAKERDSLISMPQTSLVEAASKLRLTDKDEVGEGSEIAEIILYGIMKEYYKALSVVPKIFYKQNSQDNAKGSDSVHIVINDDDFSIWFGESKFYNSIKDARLSKVIESVETSLNPEKIRKENSIIVNVGEINNLEIKDSIKKNIVDILSPGTSLDKIRPKLHIPILILHECEITKSHKIMSEEYRQKIIEYHKERAISYFTKQINKLSTRIFQYEEIRFHIILLPVPCKDDIVQSFTETANFYRKLI